MELIVGARHSHCTSVGRGAEQNLVLHLEEYTVQPLPGVRHRICLASLVSSQSLFNSPMVCCGTRNALVPAARQQRRELAICIVSIVTEQPVKNPLVGATSRNTLLFAAQEQRAEYLSMAARTEVILPMSSTESEEKGSCFKPWPNVIRSL